MTRDEAPECSQDFIDYIGTTPCDLPPPHRDDCCRVHECWYGRTGNAYRAGYAAGRRAGIEEAAKECEKFAIFAKQVECPKHGAWLDKTHAPHKNTSEE